jgi:integrase
VYIGDLVRDSQGKSAVPKEKEPNHVKGIFERPPDSDIWWINYYVDGKQRREKVGAKGDAIKLYQARKADAWRGIKLPELKNGRVTLTMLIDDALQFARNHNRSIRDYECKAEKVRKKFGSRVASEIKPREIDNWLSSEFRTAATANRYKAFLSLCYREGIANEKVELNPARLVRQRKEQEGRIRYLSREEYRRLYDVIATRFPEHLAEFIVSVHTGMRLSEQYSSIWYHFDPDLKVIDLTRTKNFSARTVHLNTEALAAIESVRKVGQKSRDRIFPREGEKSRFDTRSWFQPCLKEAGITGYVWHCNRHTFCSWLAMAGATIKEIQEAAGHKTITMAARYSHLSPAHKLSVVEKIATKKKIAKAPRKPNMH